MPRSDTPCAVGCATRLLVRRNRLNVGTCRSTSSAISAGDASIASLVTTLTLAGTSPSRCSVRVGVTVTVSSRLAGASVTSIDRDGSVTCCTPGRESAGEHGDGDVPAAGRFDGEPAVGAGRRPNFRAGADPNDDRCTGDDAAARIVNDAGD